MYINTFTFLVLLQNINVLFGPAQSTINYKQLKKKLFLKRLAKIKIF